MTVVEVIIQQGLNALMLGTIYGLIAVGFSLFFGTLDVIHFGHGDVFMLGAFAALGAALLIGPELGVVTALLVVLIGLTLTGVFGTGIARTVVMPLRDSPKLFVLLATLMLGLALREAIRVFFPSGSAPLRFPALVPRGSVLAGNVVLRYEFVWILVVGALVFFGTVLLINRTRLGLAIRAVSQNREAAVMVGVNEKFTLYATFGIGSALAAVAALMHGLYYGQIMFTMGLMGGLIGFSAATMGGLGRISGAIIGGYLFAFAQVLAAGFLPGGSEYRDVYAFTIVILFLLFRPTGVLGEAQAERA